MAVLGALRACESPQVGSKSGSKFRRVDREQGNYRGDRPSQASLRLTMRWALMALALIALIAVIVAVVLVVA